MPLLRSPGGIPLGSRRRFPPRAFAKNPDEPKECVGAVFPTQLPNLVVNVWFAIARIEMHAPPRQGIASSPATDLHFDRAACSAKQFFC